ncbi:hypothetical protein HC62_05100 [Acetobacter tropicalis]|uniref:Uncharacterized protein n=1 Tax=Acetobacter tropicalis TaxID=104102 RepID=A0A252ADU0_9PROT|nr:hypothetical protein HC62_05100 [Acetobacter tropicalis]
MGAEARRDLGDVMHGFDSSGEQPALSMISRKESGENGFNGDCVKSPLAWRAASCIKEDVWKAAFQVDAQGIG